MKPEELGVCDSDKGVTGSVPHTLTEFCLNWRPIEESAPDAPPVEEISDGYHTFNELYEHRHALFSVLCRTFDGWKSKLHSDGTMFEGWFIAGIQTPQGQATYHLPISWWEKFPCQELERAPEWDGHTPADVVNRIQTLIASPTAAEIEEVVRVVKKWCSWRRIDQPESQYRLLVDALIELGWSKRK